MCLISSILEALDPTESKSWPWYQNIVPHYSEKEAENEHPFISSYFSCDFVMFKMYKLLLEAYLNQNNSFGYFRDT